MNPFLTMLRLFNRVKKSILSLLLIALSSCEKTHITAESIMGFRDQFRGISIGDDLEQVLTELDCAEITPYSNNNIGGFSELDKNASLDISLELEEEILVAIQADVYLPDQAEAIRLMDDLGNLLSSRYGEREVRSGFQVWLDRAGKIQATEFALADETLESGSPKLSITIYNFEP